MTDRVQHLQSILHPSISSWGL